MQSGTPTPRTGRVRDPQRLELKRTIRHGEVRPAFQPIIDLRTGRTAGIEALCRPCEGAGFLGAGELFAAAERLRMLWPLEELARRATIDAACPWDRNARLFMNCSPQVVSDPRFVAAMDGALAGCPGLVRSRVVLEITERSDHRITPALARRVGQLKGLGFEIAIDDVGAGTSGLTRIMELRPHWLKLDMALAASISRDSYRQSLVRAIARFTRDSGIRLVAEGIERQADLDSVASLGVTHAQGFHLARPVERFRDVPRAAARPRGGRAAA